MLHGLTVELGLVLFLITNWWQLNQLLSMLLRSKIQEMMLRERLRAVTGKKEVMPTPAESTNASTSHPLPAACTSPRLVGFSVKNSVEPEAATSSSSALETKTFVNPWENHLFATGDHESKHHQRAIGLGLVDALSNEGGKMVVFGSQLKIKNPGTSPMEAGNLVSDVSPELFMEIELSEDYTCVTSHGPNPKKTHIFHNCIIERCDDGFIAMKETGSSDENTPLSCCDSCKEELGKGKNISLYSRENALSGDKHYHHHQQMRSDETANR